MSNRINQESPRAPQSLERSTSKKQAFTGKGSRAYTSQLVSPNSIGRGKARFDYVIRLVVREDPSAPAIVEGYVNRLLSAYERIHGAKSTLGRRVDYLQDEITAFTNAWRAGYYGGESAELGTNRSEARSIAGRLHHRRPRHYHTGLVYLLRFLQAHAGRKTEVGQRVQVILANAVYSLADRRVEEITVHAAPQSVFEVVTREDSAGKWAFKNYYNFIKSIYQRTQDPSLSPEARLDARRNLAIELDAYLRRDRLEQANDSSVITADFIARLQSADFDDDGESMRIALETLLVTVAGFLETDIKRDRAGWSQPVYTAAATTSTIPRRLDDTGERVSGLACELGTEDDRQTLMATQQADPLNYHFAPVSQADSENSYRLVTRDPALPHRLKFFGARFTPAPKQRLQTRLQDLADNAGVTVRAGRLARIFHTAMSQVADALFALPARAELADAAIEKKLTQRLADISAEDLDVLHQITNGDLCQLGVLTYYRRNVYVNIWDTRQIAGIVASGNDQDYIAITRQSYELEQRFDPYERPPAAPGENTLPSVLATRTLTMTNHWGEMTERLVVVDAELLERLRADMTAQGWDASSLEDCTLKVRFRYQTHKVPDRLEVRSEYMNLAGEGYVKTQSGWAEEWHEMPARHALRQGAVLPDYRVSMTTDTNDATKWSLEITTMVISPGGRDTYTTPGFHDYGIR